MSTRLKTRIALPLSALLLAISAAASSVQGAFQANRDGHRPGTIKAPSSEHRWAALAILRVGHAEPAVTCLAQERTPGASAKRPLTRAQLMGLVAGGVPNWRVAAFVRERGIAFQPSPEFLTDLKSVGASDGLLDSVRLAQRDAVSDKEEDHNTMPAPTDGSAPPDELKRLQQTEKQDRAAEVVRPHDPSVHFALAYVLAQEGKWDEAAAQYAAVISSQPSDVVVRNNLGLALRKSGDVDGAIREYRQALAIDPAFSETHDNLGVALMEKGDVDGAVAEFGEAVRQNPKNSQAHANLGVMLERRKDLDGAINEYRQALGVGGGEEVQLNLATALELKGDLDGAIAEFHQTLTTHPNDPRAHAGLAGALERQGDLTGALEQYAIAMKLAPEDSAIRADYERLAKASSTQMRRSSGG